jgi:tetratricopeptide (TPR) repeat protein
MTVPVAAALLALSVGSTAYGQSDAETRCLDPNQAARERIEVCTQAIGAADKSDSERLARLHNSRGNALFGTGAYDDAAAEYSRSMVLWPNLAEAYNNRCYAYAHTDHPQRGLADCDAAVRRLPNNPATLDSRGFARFKAGDYPGALSDLTIVLERDPNFLDALRHRGMVLDRMGRTADALVDYRAALGLTPGDGLLAAEIDRLERSGRATVAAQTKQAK